VKRRRDLILANAAALLVLLIVLLIGWGQEAAFGLAVLVVLNVIVIMRERSSRPRDADEPLETVSPPAPDPGRSEAAGEEESVSSDRPQITYEQARAAYEAGQKLHLGGRTYLVRPALRESGEEPILWVTDERTLGEHGLLLYPNGQVEAK